MKYFALLLVFSWVSRLQSADLYAHMMPWFESKETYNLNNSWGIHWTMDNCNPDNIINGLQDIASHYHPTIGAYASSDPDVIDWQIGHMVVSGLKGIFLDWPGTFPAYDYPTNMANGEVILRGIEAAGLKYAVVYEDNNFNLAGVPDHVAQGIVDMEYLQTNYFSSSAYVTIDGGPLLLVFGPQSLYDSVWDQIFTVLNPKPTFLTLWFQHQQGGSYAKGEFAWVFSNYIDGLNDWYWYGNVSIMVGAAYPGFDPFYIEGGWPGPTFIIDYGVATMRETLELALQYTDIIQIPTWNDYGEGTIIEPTVEAGTTILDYIATVTGSKYTKEDRQEVDDIFYLRKQFGNNATMLEELKQRHHDLVHRFD